MLSWVGFISHFRTYKAGLKHTPCCVKFPVPLPLKMTAYFSIATSKRGRSVHQEARTLQRTKLLLSSLLPLLSLGIFLPSKSTPDKRDMLELLDCFYQNVCVGHICKQSNEPSEVHFAGKTSPFPICDIRQSGS